MHPMMMMALADEAAGERRNERHRLHMRSLELARPSQASDSAPAASGLLRLIAGIRLSPRLS